MFGNYGDEDNEKLIDSHVLNGVANGKRLGILRTFDSKRKKNDKRKYTRKHIYRFCANQSPLFCGLILAACALVVTGVLSIVYGFMIPSIYKTLSNQDSQPPNASNKANFTLSKDLFLIFGIAVIGVGVIFAATGIFITSRRQLNHVKLISPSYTPILVDYELPPYETKLDLTNYAFREQRSGSITTHESPNVLDDSMISTYLVQGKVEGDFRVS